MTESGFLELKSKILELLRTGLDPKLTYHSPAHTEDVLTQSERLAAAEGITDFQTLLLLRVAALFHDTGFLRTYRGHEEVSCQIMRDCLGDHSFPEAEMDQIGSMIMATKLPQSPATLSEMIICDADLDYLGRNDFEEISNCLKDEFLEFGIVGSVPEWDRLQVNFFNSHQYFTHTAIQERLPQKALHLALLKQKLVTQ